MLWISIWATLVYSGVAAAAGMPAAQIDGGVFGVFQKVGANWQTSPSAWVDAHDHDPDGPLGSAPLERHEHWYLLSTWDPDRPDRRFRFWRAPLQHNQRPNVTYSTHILYKVMQPGTVNEIVPPTGTGPTNCGGPTRTLCPVFYDVRQVVGGPVLAQVNVWDRDPNGIPGDADDETQENFVLKPPSPGWVMASSVNCSVDWLFSPYTTSLATGNGNINAIPDGTVNWPRAFAFEVVGAGAPPNPVTLEANPPPCPP